MNAFDKFTSLLFEEAKRFLEKAHSEQSVVGIEAMSHAALLLGFSALEAHINAVADELLIRPNLNLLDASILGEKEVALKKGKFVLTDKLKMFRLEDRLSYLFSNFGKASNLQNAQWWPALKEGIELRNRLVHPKGDLTLKIADVDRFLKAILECLDALYKSIFSKSHPSYKRGLDSSLNF